MVKLKVSLFEVIWQDCPQKSCISPQNFYLCNQLHYIYSSQLGTQVANREPTLSVSCKVGYDPQPYYNPEALAVTVSSEPEEPTP